MVSTELVAIVHIIAINANTLYFQLRGLEIVQQTFCHGGELSVLQQIINEHTTIGNVTHAFSFAFSMFDLRVLDWPLNMVNVAKLSFADSILPGIGRATLKWELRSLVFGVLIVFTREGVLAPDGLNLDGVIPKFSEGHLALICFFAQKFGIGVDDVLLRRIWNIIHFVHTIIVGKNGTFNVENILELFEGKVELGDQLGLEHSAIFKSFRFSIAVLMCVSVGFGPSGTDHEELWGFMNETFDSYVALPLRDNEIERVLTDSEKGVVSMVAEQENVSVLRFWRSRTEWSFFALEAECVRGYWANEARSILFMAMSSRERHSIQMNIHSLRNITNQSCDPPIGYPAFVTGVMESCAERD
jgi:hypothetical protein